MTAEELLEQTLTGTPADWSILDPLTGYEQEKWCVMNVLGAGPYELANFGYA